MNDKTDKTDFNDLQNSSDITDKEYSDFEENISFETEETKEMIPGPLSRRPSFTSLYPAVFLSMFFLICTRIISNSSFADKLWSSHDAVFTKHEYWRLFTALFIHADIIHLVSNIPAFILFGLLLYEYFGFLLFPVISLTTGIGANAVTLWFYQDSVRLVGASGMIYGMVSMWLVLYIYFDSSHSILMRIFRAIGFSFIVLFPETYNPSTSYLAHASGFLIGIVSSLAILPFIHVKKITNKSG